MLNEFTPTRKSTSIENVKRHPLYYRVFNIIKKQIEDGVYKEGDLLPAEPLLEQQFNVSRTTIRKAIEMLEQQGLVIKKQGRGTIVTDPKTIQKLNLVTSFTETLMEKGYKVTSKDITVDFVIPPPWVADALKINSDIKIVKIERIKLINGKPIAIVTNYLLPTFVPGIERKIDKLNSLYALLENEYNIRITSAVEYIGARLADAIEAKILRGDKGTVLLISKRITYSNGQVLEVAITKIKADMYEYCIYMNGRPE
jgi:GntR family transcriptional regulator